MRLFGSSRATGGHVKVVSAVVLLFLISLPAAAQFQPLPSFRNPQYNPRNAEGTFDVLVHVDGEAFIYVKDTDIKYLPVSGAPIRDAGSNYSQGIPKAVFGAFNMVKIAGRGDVNLHEEPGPGNDYTAIIRLNDRQSGSNLYHIRLDWTWNPANPRQPPGGRNSRPLESSRNDNRDYNRDRTGSFEFRGSVDDATVLHIRSDQVREEDISGKPIRGSRFVFSQPLPAERLRSIELIDVEGRGEVELVEKPWEGNKFTAVIRISDRQRGNNPYRFKLVWSR
jgi:hypothetical protein